MPESTKPYTVRLRPETVQELKQTAEALGLSQGELIERALKDYKAEPDDSPRVRRLATMPLEDRIEYGSIVLANLHATGHFAIQLYDGQNVIDLPQPYQEDEKFGTDRPVITDLGYNADFKTFQIAINLPDGVLRKRRGA
ncbi:ribbon-helix-helix protein, CopG family [Methylobacterium phyllosphaerae]